MWVLCIVFLLYANENMQVWIAPLSTQDILPEERRADFIEQVFWNIHDVIAVNTRLRDALNKRQKSYAVIEGVADIFLEIVPHFAPFVSYGSHQLYGKYEFEKEKSSNPAFAQFVEVRTCPTFGYQFTDVGLGNGAPA